MWNMYEILYVYNIVKNILYLGYEIGIGIFE